MRPEHIIRHGSGAILNLDRAELQKRRLNKKRAQRLDQLEEDMSTLKNDIRQIKELLMGNKE